MLHLRRAPNDHVPLEIKSAGQKRRTYLLFDSDRFSMTSPRSSLFGYCIGERLLTAFGEPIEKHQIHLST
jgi:hypothetical protein